MSDTSHSKTITRFPPSPTGWFHIGNVRTVLFNYFFTKQKGGVLKFRLEDTDKARSEQKYADDIIEGLKWLGIELDFNNVYKQSEQSATYRKYLERLISENKAYISQEEPKEEGQRGEVIRLRNSGQEIVFTDMIRGEVKIDTTELGDFVIAKSLDEPIYHFAVVVDDFEMGVTHILRGEDGIYNTPRQILIQEALGFSRPMYAHLPFILNSDKSKLSKRKQGERVSLRYYREKGFLPEAMVNFLAFIGWNPGDEREIMSMADIIDAFDIMKVQKSGAVFNEEKLLWINKQYLKKLPIEIVEQEIEKRLGYGNIDLIKKITPLILERIGVWSDIDDIKNTGELNFFWKTPNFDKELLYWKKDPDAKNTANKLLQVKEILTNYGGIWEAESIKNALWDYVEQAGKGNVLWPLRVSLTGQDKSPEPFIVAAILGKEEVLRRLDEALNKLY